MDAIDWCTDDDGDGVTDTVGKIAAGDGDAAQMLCESAGCWVSANKTLSSHPIEPINVDNLVGFDVAGKDFSGGIRADDSLDGVSKIVKQGN